MSSNNVLITGGTGFFGRSLLRHYLSSDLSVDTSLTILTRNPHRFRLLYPELTLSKRLRFVEGDIEYPDSFPTDQRFTHILHAATDSTLGPTINPLEYYNQIVKGTSNLLDFAVKHRVPRFLLTSSGGVYGPQPPELPRLSESYLGAPPLNEISAAYSHGKRAAEHLCHLYSACFDLKFTIARCFAFVGPDLPLDAHFAIGNLIKNAMDASDLIIKGDGTPIRSYLDQRDLASWLWFLLFNGRNQEVYNVGSDEAITIHNLAIMIRDLISPKSEVIVLGQGNVISYRNIYIPDISKIYDHYSLRPKYHLQDSIVYCCSKLSR